MVDIRELARLSGVSPATVSRALNDRAEVSPETRRRILEMADRLGYSPNQPARTLVRRRSDMIGLVWDTGYTTQDRRHPFLLDLFVGIKQTLAESGYHLMVLSTAGAASPDDVTFYLRAAQQHSLAGVIMMGVDADHPAITALVDSGTACVGIDLPLHRNRTTYVTSDNQAGAATAVSHLHSLGHTAIATITGPLTLMPAAERLAGYHAEMARLGLTPDPRHIVDGDFFLASGYEAARRLLDLPDPPTAIFAAGDEMAIGALHALADAGLRVPRDMAGDEMAIGALHALADAGLRVPRDMAVVGFDDIEAAALVRPTLTTVAQDRVALGAGAVEALVDALDANDGVTHAPLRVATRLVVRGSCGASVEAGG